MTVTDPFPIHNSVFLLWLEENGCTLSPKIKLEDLRHRAAGRGVVAIADIEKDEDLFTIPRSSILTLETSKIPTSFLQGLDEPWLALILAMIYEDRRGSDSPWSPYLGVFPTEFDTLMFWSNTELTELKGSAVLDKIGKAKAEQSFLTKVLPVITANKDAFFANFLSDEQLIGLCHRMASIIMAYAFDIEQGNQSDDDGDSNSEASWAEDDGSDEQKPQVGLIPMADMLNADADRNNAKLFYMEDKVVMRSIQNIKQGEEIFNDYGPLPRADLLRRYGYITNEYAKYDVVEVDSALVSEVAVKKLGLSLDTVQNRVNYLEEMDLPMDAFDIAHSSAEDGQFPIELIALLNTLTLNESDFNKLSAKQSKPSRSLSSDRPQSLELLLAILESRRGQYGTPSEKQQLQTQTARRHEMAAQVIAGEKAVLKEALQQVQDLLKSTSNKRGAAHDNSHGSRASKQLKR